MNLVFFYTVSFFTVFFFFVVVSSEENFPQLMHLKFHFLVLMISVYGLHFPCVHFYDIRVVFKILGLMASSHTATVKSRYFGRFLGCVFMGKVSFYISSLCCRNLRFPFFLLLPFSSFPLPIQLPKGIFFFPGALSLKDCPFISLPSLYVTGLQGPS